MDLLTKLALALALALPNAVPASGQLARRNEAPAAPAPPAPHRTRLFLKDGSYQVVMSYTVAGNKVRYVSAERGGDQEEIPLVLVDLVATGKWEAQHAAPDPNLPPEERPAPAIDPELLKEEADRAALAPEVAPGLRLAPDLSVLALDAFRATPQLVPLTQTDGELNRQTGHNILRSMVNPTASPHQILVLKGERAAVQMHVNDPVFYLKLDDELPSSGEALTVDTHGASAQAEHRKQGNSSEYVVVRLDVRQDARVVASVNTALLGARAQEDVIETQATTLAGGHWVKVAPQGSLLIGEYALVEILDRKSVNLGVWDFGIHPTAPENRDLVKPEPKRPSTLERRGRN